MTNIEIAFSTLGVIGIIGIILTLLYERKLRKLHKNNFSCVDYPSHNGRWVGEGNKLNKPLYL